MSTASPSFFFLLPRPPPSSTLFPYTTLFRSLNPRGFAGCHDPSTRSYNTMPRQSRRTAADRGPDLARAGRSEEHTSELQSQFHLVCRLLLEKKNTRTASN